MNKKDLLSKDNSNKFDKHKVRDFFNEILRKENLMSIKNYSFSGPITIEQRELTERILYRIMWELETKKILDFE